MGHELDKLKQLYGVGTANVASYGGQTLGAPPAETATPEQKAAFADQLRKYQIDQQAYKAYADEYANRLGSTNMYAQPQYDTNQARFKPAGQVTVMGQPDTSMNVARTQGSGKISDLLTRAGSTYDPLEEARKQIEQEKTFWGKARPDVFGNTQATVMGQPDTLTATRAVLNAPTYGAIPATMSTPAQQGVAYKQMRDLGYTDADIRAATSKITGTPSDQMMANIYKVAYPQYTQAIESQYGSQFNRSGYGTGAGQIDYPGFNYYINQLSTGAVTPATLESAIRGGATVPTTTPATTPGSDINALYQQYFNRKADPAGLQYWQQSGLTGDALKNAIIAGAQENDLNYYNQYFNRQDEPYYGGAARGGYISGYAHGGPVRTHYQTGGELDLGGNMEGLEEFYRDPRNFTRPSTTSSGTQSGGIGERLLSARSISNEQPNEIRVDVNALAPEGETVAPPAARQQGAGRSRLDDIFARYFPEAGSASRELTEARRRSQSESEAFYNLIRQMAERGESPASRSEMYFRLASAFGAPTRTGSIGETLSKVGEQMGEYTKGRRSEEAERRNLLLRAQEARMAGAREDLATSRALAGQESAERRALLGKIIEEEIRANRPTERQQRIAEIMTTYNVDRETAMNIVNNIETTVPNPVTGELMRYNRITRQGEPVPMTPGGPPAARVGAAPAAPAAAAAPGAPAAASSGAGRPSSAQPPQTLWEMAPRVTGAVPAIREAVQGVTGQVGVNVAPEGLIRERQTFAAVQNDLIRALSVNPRFPVAEMQRIEREIAISPSALTDPVGLRERMLSVDTYLRGRLENEDRAANDTSLPVDDRRAALSAANSIRNFLAQLGVPEGGRSRSEPAQRNRPQAPRVGTVVDGYRFLGGDPSDQNNWSRE